MQQRYQRQQLVSVLPDGAQEKLAAGKVLIVGVGGLGCPASQQLAGAGVGQLTLVDGDTVSMTNLHRQFLYREADAGQYKAEIAARRLTELNSTICVVAHTDFLGPDNVESLVADHSLVIDAADRFAVSYVLSDYCFKQRIPFISASVLQTQGYLGVFCGTPDMPAPSLRALFPAPPQSSGSCDTVGVLGSSAGVIGSLQAQEALKVLVGDSTRLNGQLLQLDMWNYRQSVLDFSTSDEPDFAPIIGPLALNQKQDFVLDVRSEQEFAELPVQNADLNIPLDQLGTRLNALPEGRRLVCQCQTGQRALNAAHQLIVNGFPHVAVRV